MASVSGSIDHHQVGGVAQQRVEAALAAEGVRRVAPRPEAPQQQGDQHQHADQRPGQPLGGAVVGSGGGRVGAVAERPGRRLQVGQRGIGAAPLCGGGAGAAAPARLPGRCRSAAACSRHRRAAARTRPAPAPGRPPAPSSSRPSSSSARLRSASRSTLAATSCASAARSSARSASSVAERTSRAANSTAMIARAGISAAPPAAVAAVDHPPGQQGLQRNRERSGLRGGGRGHRRTHRPRRRRA